LPGLGEADIESEEVRILHRQDTIPGTPERWERIETCGGGGWSLPGAANAIVK